MMQKHAMFLLGEPEYESHLTMPGLAKEFAKKYGWRVSICISDPIEEKPGVQHEFKGMDSLDDVDVLVIYTRFRRLKSEQWEMILDYINAGRPVVGLRTATHSFLFKGDSEYFWYAEEFGQKLFGTEWKYHNGRTSTTDVSVIEEKANHPILQGVEKNFKMRSWLYHVIPLPYSCNCLLTGKSINSYIKVPSKIAENPVAWTNFYNDGRMFYTSLGHQEDFENQSFRNLVMNGIRWAGGEI